MNPHLYPRLLGDVGGTNARFAWQQAADRPIVDVASLPCAQHASIEQAIRHYLSTHSREAPRAGAIGLATAIRLRERGHARPRDRRQKAPLSCVPTARAAVF